MPDRAEILRRVRNYLRPKSADNPDGGHDVAWVENRLREHGLPSLSALGQPEPTRQSRPPATSPVGMVFPFTEPEPINRIAEQMPNTGILLGTGATLGAAAGPWMPQGVRDRIQQARAETPMSGGVEALGSMALPLGAVGAVGRGAGFLRGLLLPSVATGAGVGAVAGASGAETMRDVPGAALRGGWMGAGIGAALPVAGAGLLGLARGARGLIAPAAADATRLQGQVAKMAERSGMTPEAVRVRLSVLEAADPGFPVMADASPVFGKQLRTAANLNEGPAEVVGQRLAERAVGTATNPGGQVARFREATVQAAKLDPGVDAYLATKNAEGALKTVAEKVYGPLDKLPALTRDQVAEFGPLLARERALAQEFQKVPTVLADDLSFGRFQHVARKLKGNATEAARKGNGAEAQAWGELHDAFTQKMEDFFAGYREANRAYARSAAAVDAVENGVKAWSERSVASIRDDLARLADKGGPEAVEAYRTGVMDRAIKSGDLARLLRGPGTANVEKYAETLEKLRAIFPDDGSFAQHIHGRLEPMQAMRRTLAIFGEDSTTARQLAAMQEMGDIATGGATGGLRGGLESGLANILQRAHARIATAGQRRTAKELMDLLASRPDAVGGQRLLGLLESAPQGYTPLRRVALPMATTGLLGRQY